MKSNVNEPTEGAIVANALISEKTEHLKLDKLPPDIRAAIVAARLTQGLKPISIRWLSGQFGIVLCPAGDDMPTFQQVLSVYRECERQKLASAGGSGRDD